jgi:hypothetical protein
MLQLEVGRSNGAAMRVALTGSIQGELRVQVLRPFMTRKADETKWVLMACGRGVREGLRGDEPGRSSPPFDQQQPSGLCEIYFLAMTTGTVSIWPVLANSSRSALVSGL